MKKELGYLVLGAVMAGAITGGLVHAQANASATDQQFDPTVCQREHEGKGFGFHGGDTNWLSDHAELLGMSTEELQSALDSGKTMQQITEEKGITVEQMHQFMQDKMKEQLAQDVSEGKITQEQADLRLQRMEQMEEKFANGEEFGGFKKGMGFGQMRLEKAQ